jgi:hypothetical protein
MAHASHMLRIILTFPFGGREGEAAFPCRTLLNHTVRGRLFPLTTTTTFQHGLALAPMRRHTWLPSGSPHRAIAEPAVDGSIIHDESFRMAHRPTIPLAGGWHRPHHRPRFSAPSSSHHGYGIRTKVARRNLGIKFLS